MKYSVWTRHTDPDTGHVTEVLIAPDVHDWQALAIQKSLEVVYGDHKAWIQ